MDLGVVLRLRVADVLADRDGVGRLDGVVELLARPARELVDDPPGAGRAEQVGAVDDRAARRIRAMSHMSSSPIPGAAPSPRRGGRRAGTASCTCPIDALPNGSV